MKILIFFLLFLCFISTCFSSQFSISDDIFTIQPLFGRNLLQNKKPCPVNFELQNYTIITSRCKAPQYPLKSCCDAFKEFACQYTEYLNDLSNDCSEKMFTYINFNGNYTQGFFTMCRDDKMGLVCPASPPGTGVNNVVDDSNNSPYIPSALLLTLIVGFFILFVLI